MGKSRRVGGSGWAGVHGSFIGLSKAKPSGKGGFRLAKPKKPRKKPASSARIDLKSLPDSLEVQRIAKRMQAVQADIEATRKRLHALESQLALVTNDLKTALGRHRTMKAGSSLADTKPKARAKAEGAKLTPEERLAERQARERWRNSLKPVEVEYRAGGVIIGKGTTKCP